MHIGDGGDGRSKPLALSLLASERPRNVGWRQAAGFLFGDWGTSRLYVLGLALFFAGRTSFWLIAAMSLLILAVGWAYTQICRIYPDGGGVYTAAKSRSRTLAVIGALLLFADYTVTASLSVLDAFHYFGLPLQHHAQVAQAKDAASSQSPAAGDSSPAADPAHTAGSTVDRRTSNIEHRTSNEKAASAGAATANKAASPAPPNPQSEVRNPHSPPNPQSVEDAGNGIRLQ